MIQRPTLALALRTLAALMLSTVLLLVKLGGERFGLQLPEVVFWRQFLLALAVFGCLASRGELARLKTDRPWMHARRAVVGTATMYFVLTATRLLPLSEATVLTFTTPLFAVCLSALFLREAVGLVRWSAVMLGLAGVLVMVGFDTAHIPALGAAAGLAGAVGGGLVAIQIRQLGRTEEPIRVVFWFSLFGALMLSPGAAIYGSGHGLQEWLLLGAIGLAGLLSQIFSTASLRYGAVSSVIVMDYTQLFWATLYGWLIFADVPPIATWIGAPTIIAAGILVVWREHRLSRQATS